MPYVEFDNSLRVGNRLMDQEHEMLISYINQLQKVIENEADGNAVKQVVRGLVEYSRTHFFVEEELMKAYGYPEVEFHLKAHAGFRDSANALVRDFDMGDEIDLDQMLAFLTEWLTTHILNVDAKLADFLRDKQLV